MLSKRVIPCLDVRAGRLTKGIKFQGLRGHLMKNQEVTMYIVISFLYTICTYPIDVSYRLNRG